MIQGGIEKGYLTRSVGLRPIGEQSKRVFNKQRNYKCPLTNIELGHKLGVPECSQYLL